MHTIHLSKVVNLARGGGYEGPSDDGERIVQVMLLDRAFVTNV
jgi:hypothetical protein